MGAHAWEAPKPIAHARMDSQDSSARPVKKSILLHRNRELKRFEIMIVHLYIVFAQMDSQDSSARR